MERGARTPLEPVPFLRNRNMLQLSLFGIREEEGVMSLSNGPAETLNEPPPGGADAVPSAYAPKWVRDAHAAPRKVVPLRLPAAPQLVPADAPVPAHAAARRPTGPELLAEDEVLKRLLARHSPDPQPLPVRPIRDRVGLALGMFARLIVAACAAALAALLCLGVVPLPFRPAASVAHEGGAPVAPVAPPVALARPYRCMPARLRRPTGGCSTQARSNGWSSAARTIWRRATSPPLVSFSAAPAGRAIRAPRYPSARPTIRPCSSNCTCSASSPTSHRRAPGTRRRPAMDRARPRRGSPRCRAPIHSRYGEGCGEAGARVHPRPFPYRRSRARRPPARKHS